MQKKKTVVPTEWRSFSSVGRQTNNELKSGKRNYIKKKKELQENY